VGPASRSGVKGLTMAYPRIALVDPGFHQHPPTPKKDDRSVAWVVRRGGLTNQIHALVDRRSACCRSRFGSQMQAHYNPPSWEMIGSSSWPCDVLAVPIRAYDSTRCARRRPTRALGQLRPGHPRDVPGLQAAAAITATRSIASSNKLKHFPSRRTRYDKRGRQLPRRVKLASASLVAYSQTSRLSTRAGPGDHARAGVSSAVIDRGAPLRSRPNPLVRTQTPGDLTRRRSKNKPSRRTRRHRPGFISSAANTGRAMLSGSDPAEPRFPFVRRRSVVFFKTSSAGMLRRYGFILAMRRED